MDDVPNYEISSFPFRCVQSKNIPAYLSSNKSEQWHNDFETHLNNCQVCKNRLISESFRDMSAIKLIPISELNVDTAEFLDYEISELISKFLTIAADETEKDFGIFLNLRERARRLFKSLVREN